MKEKAGWGKLPQLAEFVRLATPLARFGKVVRTASKQGVASSSLAGRPSSISLNRNELEKLAVTPIPLRRKQMVGLSENGKTCHFLAFLGLFGKLNCHEIVTPTQV
jgi:hypothetical protein